MANTTKKHLSQEEVLKKYNVLFENLKSNEQIVSELASYGVGEEEIAKGEALYRTAQEKYLEGIKLLQGENATRATFVAKYEQLQKVYADNRNKVRVIYKDNDVVLTNLKLKGRSSEAYSSVIANIRIFYVTIDQDNVLRKPLESLKITSEFVKEQLQKLSETEKAYAEYTDAKSKKQQSTQDKNKAFAELEKWGSYFYAIAKIALKESPQRLQSFAKSVRS